MFSDTTDEAVNLVSSRAVTVKPEPFFTSPVKPEPADHYRRGDEGYDAYRDDEYRPMEEDYRQEDVLNRTNVMRMVGPKSKSSRLFPYA